MVSIASLWLPIVLSAVFVFIASSIIHMLLPYHRSDFRGVPSEAEVMGDLRKQQIPPGDYFIPHAATNAERQSPEYQDKLKNGPVVILSVQPAGPPNMGRLLGQWFVYCLVVSFFSAYITGRALGPDAHYLSVFRFAGTMAFAGYGLGILQNSIWYGRQWSSTFKSVFDAAIYALVTAGTFGWLWA